MLVLALDTATPAVTAGVVEVRSDVPGSAATRSVRVAHDARKHGELLMPAVLAVCAEAGTTLQEVGAIVVGTGPGPFTGLRVGMVTAAALGDALGVPARNPSSAHATSPPGPGAAGGTTGSPRPPAQAPAATVTPSSARRPASTAGASTCGPVVRAPAAS